MKDDTLRLWRWWFWSEGLIKLNVIYVPSSDNRKLKTAREERGRRGTSLLCLPVDHLQSWSMCEYIIVVGDAVGGRRSLITGTAARRGDGGSQKGQSDDSAAANDSYMVYASTAMSAVCFMQFCGSTLLSAWNGTRTFPQHVTDQIIILTSCLTMNQLVNHP